MSTQLTTQNVSLDDLDKGIPVISPGAMGLYIETCMFCMGDQGHQSGIKVLVNVLGNDKQMLLHWKQSVTHEYRYRYGGNQNRTTENGATAIALLSIREYTDYTAVREAPANGTRVDYYLCRQDMQDDTFIFDCVDAYCEVRGIRKESRQNSIARAVAQKISRLDTAIGIDQDLPCYVVVVEFSKPQVRIVEK